MKIIEITESVTEITAIAAATKAKLEAMDIIIDHEAAIPTIAYVQLRAAVAYLAENKPTSVNLFNLINLGISHADVEGEKDGNYTPYSEPGQLFELKDIGEDEIEEDENNEKVLEIISEKARKILASDFGITLNTGRGVNKITQEFLRMAVSYLKNSKEPGTEVLINLFHMIELGIADDNTEEGGEADYITFVAPGQEFKLMAKSDGETED